MLKSLDRYVLKEIVSPFAIGLFVYTLTLLIHNVLLLSNALIARGVTMTTVFKILAYILPDLLSFTVPMSTLMGILAGMSRMSTDSEIVALRTLGVGNGRLLKPVMLFSFLMWLLSSWLIMYAAPESNYRASRMIARAQLSNAVSNIKPRTFFRNFPYYILYFNDRDRDTGQWLDIFLYSLKRSNNDTMILARKGRFVMAEDPNENHVALEGAVVHGFDKTEPAKAFTQSFAFLREYIPYNMPLKQTRRHTQQPLPQLIQAIQYEPDNVALKMEFHRKFALPFSCLVFGFLALSLGISTKKGGKISGFIISLGIIFLYYTALTTAKNMVLKRIVPPFWGLWIPNLFLLVLGVVLYYLTSREKSFRFERTIPALVRLFTRMRERWRKPRRVLFVLKVKRVRFRLVKILDLYVLKRLVLLFIMVYSSLVMAISIVTMVELLDEAIKNEVSFHYVLLHVVYSIPEYSGFFLPSALLTAVLLTFSLMSKNNEIIAVQVSGIGLPRLTLPALFLGLFVSLGAFALQELVTPTANEKAQEARHAISRVQPPRDIEMQKNWVAAEGDRFYFFNFFDKKRSRFLRFNILDFSENFQVRSRTQAEVAEWLGDGRLLLKSGFQRTYEDQLPAGFTSFRRREIDIATPLQMFTRKIAFSQFMNIRELNQYIDYLERNQSATLKYEAKLYHKYAFPFSSFVMVLIAIPFSFIMGNKGALYGIGIAVGISMIYWGLVGIFSAFGSIGLLSPLLSAAASPLIIAAASVYMFLNVRS